MKAKALNTKEEKPTILPNAKRKYRASKHFSDLSALRREQSPISLEVYNELEILISEGLPFHPSLQALGIVDGEQDETWLKFQAMFPAQYRDLKRLAAAAELQDLRTIRAGGRGWQSVMTYRERTQTERYGQRSKTGKMASPGTAIGAILATAKSGKK